MGQSILGAKILKFCDTDRDLGHNENKHTNLSYL